MAKTIDNQTFTDREKFAKRAERLFRSMGMQSIRGRSVDFQVSLPRDGERKKITIERLPLKLCHRMGDLESGFDTFLVWFRPDGRDVSRAKDIKKKTGISSLCGNIIGKELRWTVLVR
jgi:hypothetical protein